MLKHVCVCIPEHMCKLGTQTHRHTHAYMYMYKSEIAYLCMYMIVSELCTYVLMCVGNAEHASTLMGLFPLLLDLY